MKLGQMASYLDEGLPEPLRAALAAAAVERAADERRARRRGDRARARRAARASCSSSGIPQPIAAASIGQVHRAVVVDPATGLERAVAVKVQYPGVGEAIEADLRNADLLGALLQQGFGGLDPDEMVAEIKERIDRGARLRARGAQPAARSPTTTAATRSSTSPRCCPHSRRAACSPPSWSTGARGRSCCTWPQAERDLAGEMPVPLRVPQPVRHARVQRRPAPGQLPVPRRRHGHVPRLRAGQALHRRRDGDVRRRWSKAAASTTTSPTFRRDRRRRRHAAPRRTVPTTRSRRVLQPVLRERRATTAWSRGQREYASRIVRHTFDRTSPIAQYATVPRAFVFIQRINLGLYALLGELQATRQLPADRRGAVAVRARPARARRWPKPSSRGSRRDAAVTVCCPADRLLAQPPAQLSPTADRHRLGVDLDADGEAPGSQLVARNGQRPHALDAECGQALRPALLRLRSSSRRRSGVCRRSLPRCGRPRALPPACRARPERPLPSRRR